MPLLPLLLLLLLLLGGGGGVVVVLGTSEQTSPDSWVAGWLDGILLMFAFAFVH